MTIEEAKLDDLVDILVLQNICYQENAVRYNDNQIQPLTQTLDELKQQFSNYQFLKIEDSSKIIGSIRAYAQDGVCHIGKLIVHPDYQNKGLGTKLMQNIESRFVSVIKYKLFTGYKDEKNLYLYKKLGYVITNEESENITSPRFVFMEKNNDQKV